MRRTGSSIGAWAFISAVAISSCTADVNATRTTTPTASGLTTTATPTSPPVATTVPAPPLVTSPPQTVDDRPPVRDSVPIIETASDTGCLDHPGSLSADADNWYPTGSAGWVHLAGARAVGPELDDFEESTAALLGRAAPGFVAVDRDEFRTEPEGCATHRYVTFERGEDSVVIAAWRVVAPADPFWVPNEAAFVAIDDSTLVSDGEHLDVALAVGPDGTTARITAYGSGARELVAGWPTTIAAGPSTPEPGVSPLDAAELVPLAHELLAVIAETR